MNPQKVYILTQIHKGDGILNYDLTVDKESVKKELDKLHDRIEKLKSDIDQEEISTIDYKFSILGSKATYMAEEILGAVMHAGDPEINRAIIARYENIMAQDGVIERLEIIKGRKHLILEEGPYSDAHISIDLDPQAYIPAYMDIINPIIEKSDFGALDFKIISEVDKQIALLESHPNIDIEFSVEWGMSLEALLEDMIHEFSKDLARYIEKYPEVKKNHQALVKKISSVLMEREEVQRKSDLNKKEPQDYSSWLEDAIKSGNVEEALRIAKIITENAKDQKETKERTEDSKSTKDSGNENPHR